VLAALTKGCMEIFFVIIILSLGVAYWTYRVSQWGPVYCEKCGEKMKLESVEDPTGFVKEDNHFFMDRPN